MKLSKKSKKAICRNRSLSACRTGRDLLKEYLKKTGSLLEGHFLLSSGLHSHNYVQCALALKNPLMAEKIGKKLAELWERKKPDIIISPAMGGIIIGHEVAKAFKVDFLWTERENNRMTLKRGFSIKKGQKVIIVEDVFTTGKSTMEVDEVVQTSGGIVLGALSIINRMSGKKFYFPHQSLLNLDIKNHAPEECPLCKEKIPLIKPGSRSGIR